MPDEPITPQAILGLMEQTTGAVEAQGQGDATLWSYTPDALRNLTIKFIWQWFDRGVTVTGDGLNSAGQEQGMMVYTHDPLPAKGILSVSLSGVSSAADSGGQGQSGGQEGNSRTGPEVAAAPSRLDDFKWYLFAGLAALFAMGAILLTRKQVVVASGPQDEDVPQTKPPKPAKQKKAAPPPAPAPSAKVAPANSNAAHVAASVNHQVSVSMDSLKDQIFRLELRRQAGTISEEDYAREKAQVEKLLRDLVKG